MLVIIAGLKKLEIDGFWGKVTDFSIKHGVKHLPNLQSVMLRGCKVGAA